MSDRTPSSHLPQPSETSHITRRRPSQPLPITPQEPQRHLHQHACQSPNCAVQESLSTPELLENTLSHLPTKDVLSLRRVSKTWHSLITTSPSLRLHLFLEPQWNRPALDFQLLPCTTIPDLQIVRGEPVHLGQWIEATMTPQAARSISRKIYSRPAARKINMFCGVSSRRPVEEEEVEESCSDGDQRRDLSSSSSSLSPQQIADLFLTQPPLVAVQASVVVAGRGASPAAVKTSPSDTATAENPPTLPRQEEEGEEETDPDPSSTTVAPSPPLAHSKLACDAGITLGFMAEAANFLLRDLELSVGSSGEGGGGGVLEDGKQNQKQKRQQEDVVVVFRAIVSFCAQTDGAPRMRSGTRFVTMV
jgi:hypothetical protein